MPNQVKLLSLAVGNCPCVNGDPSSTGHVFSVLPDVTSGLMGNASSVSIVIAPCGVGIIIPNINNIKGDNLPSIGVGASVVGCFQGIVIQGDNNVNIN